MKKIFSILAAAAVVFAFTSCGSKSTPEKVAEKFLTHVAKSEFKDAKSLATGDAVKTIETMEGLLSMGGEKPATVKDVKIENVKCDTKDNESQCTYTKDGKEGGIGLTKVDGAWKVSTYNKENPMDSEDVTATEEETPETPATDDVKEEAKK